MLGHWMLAWLLGVMDLPGRAKLGYDPEEESNTHPPLPKIALSNLRNWRQGLSWSHVLRPGSGVEEVKERESRTQSLGSWKEEGLEVRARKRISQ